MVRSLKSWAVIMCAISAAASAMPPVAPSTPICDRLLAAHGKILTTLRTAAAQTGENIAEIESAFFGALNANNLRVENISAIFFVIPRGFRSEVHEFSVVMVDGTKRMISIPATGQPTFTAPAEPVFSTMPLPKISDLPGVIARVAAQAAAVNGEDAGKIRELLTAQLAEKNFTEATVSSLEYYDTEDVGSSYHKIKVTTVNGNVETLTVALEPPGPPMVIAKTVEISDLAQLVKDVVPDDRSYSEYVGRKVREWAESRNTDKNRVGDIALQALALMKALEYVYVDPSELGGAEGFKRGWISAKDYDDTWGKVDSRGGKDLGGSLESKLFDVELAGPIGPAIELLQGVGYRWVPQNRKFEKYEQADLLVLKSGMDI